MGPHSVHELNFLTHFDAHGFTENAHSEVLPRDINLHFQYHHLLDVAVPAHKLIGVFDAVLPITKRGRTKGAKNRKDPSQKPSSESKPMGRKHRGDAPSGLVVVIPMEKE